MKIEQLVEPDLYKEVAENIYNSTTYEQSRDGLLMIEAHKLYVMSAISKDLHRIASALEDIALENDKDRGAQREL